MSGPTSVTTVPVGTPGGPVDVPDRLRFVEPPPGLPGTEYTLDALDETGFLFALRGEGGVRLFVVSPGLVFPDYAPSIPRTVLDAVSDDEPDAVLLVVVHPGSDERPVPTADLLAPIVVGRATGLALQTVLDEDLPLRAPLA